MRSYLNLDLLFNINYYLFPLFYYSIDNDEEFVYSPMTCKSIHFYIFYISDNFSESLLYDYKKNCSYNYDCKYELTEEYLIYSDTSFERCGPFELSKEHISFLKSNNRINTIY